MVVSKERKVEKGLRVVVRLFTILVERHGDKIPSDEEVSNWNRFG